MDITAHKIKLKSTSYSMGGLVSSQLKLNSDQQLKKNN